MPLFLQQNGAGETNQLQNMSMFHISSIILDLFTYP